MKKLLKKLKESWLDYLIIFISVGAICFVYLFTAFYQPKENKQNVNKENIVKVLRDKKNLRGSFGATDYGTIVIGEALSDTNDSEIKYVVNFLNIELFEYQQNSFIEFELEFETESSLYLYKSASQYLETNSINKTFSISFEIPLGDYYTGNKINEISLGTSDFYTEINSIDLDDIETFYIDIYYEISFAIYVDTGEGDVLYENYYDYKIQTEFTASVYDQTASQYVNSLSSILDENTIRYIPNQLRYFNLYDIGFDSGYQDGYNDGVIDNEDYYEDIIIPEIKEEYEEIGYNNGYDYGLEIGYNNGYNDGVIAGSNDFNLLNFIRSLCDLLWGVLNVEMLPNIKLIYIVSIPLVLSVVRFILGWFR